MTNVPRTSATSQRAAASQQEQESSQQPKDDPMQSIRKSALDVLREKSKQLTKTNRQLNALQKDYDKLDKAYSTSEELREQLTENVERKTKELESLTARLEETQKLLRKNGKVHESELNKELSTKVKDIAKTIMFRTWKIPEDIEDLKVATRELIKYLPNKEKDIEPETEESFVEKYHLVTNEGFNLARQYVQNESKKAAEGTQNVFLLLLIYYVIYPI